MRKDKRYGGQIGHLHRWALSSPFEDKEPRQVGLIVRNVLCNAVQSVQLHGPLARHTANILEPVPGNLTGDNRRILIFNEADASMGLEEAAQESMAIVGRPYEYEFVMDLEAAEASTLLQAVESLQACADRIVLMGMYQRDRSNES